MRRRMRRNRKAVIILLSAICLIITVVYIVIPTRLNSTIMFISFGILGTYIGIISKREDNTL